MKKLVYLLLFVTTIGLTGLAIAQTDDSNNPNPPAGTTGTTGSSNTHSSTMNDTAGRHFVTGTVVSISESENSIVLSNVQAESNTYSSSRSGSSGSTASPDTTGSTGSSSATSENQTFQLSGSTKFSKGKASDIKAGDRVKLELDSANMVQKVSVIKSDR
jgi:hypothetical protein